MKTRYTEGEIRALLAKHCYDAGSQKQWAALHGVSQAYVSDVLSGRRDPGESILQVLGFKRVVYYEPAD